MTFAEELRAVRAAGRITQRDMGAMLGVSYEMIRRYETGSAQPREDLQARLRGIATVLSRLGASSAGLRSPEGGAAPDGTSWAEFIRRMRTGMQLSTRAFGRKLGVGEIAVRSWEGGAVPRMDMQERLRALHEGKPLPPLPPRLRNVTADGTTHLEPVGAKRPRHMPEGVVRCLTLWRQNESRRWAVVAEGAVFSDGSVALRWLAPAGGLNPNPHRWTSNYLTVDTLRRRLRVSGDDFTISWRE